MNYDNFENKTELSIFLSYILISIWSLFLVCHAWKNSCDKKILEDRLDKLEVLYYIKK